MALPSSGAISFNQINVELGLAGTTTISLNQASVRTLFGVASGAISMSDGYGKANQFSFTISTNQTNANLRTLAVNAGWNQSSKVVATIGSGIYCSSNSTGTPGLTINGSFPGGVELVNGGFIIGMGGAGGVGYGTNSNANQVSGSAGSSGGTALSVSSAVTITNNGTIGGGGGGGGGGSSDMVYYGKTATPIGGGGGGGGRTGLTNSAGGAGSNGTGSNGGAGGAGTNSSAGNGGSAADPYSGIGGAGGGWGSSGSTGLNGSVQNSPTYIKGPGSGGGGGAAITGNTNITYVTTGTRLGSIT